MLRITWGVALLIALAPMGISQNYSENLDNGIPSNFTQETSDVTDWSWTIGSTPSAGTGPTMDHTTGSGGYMFLEATGLTQGDDAVITGPPLDGSGGGVMLTFWYHMSGAGMGDLEVQDFDGTNWNTIWTMSGDQGTAWLTATVPLATYGANNRSQFRFRAVRGATFTSDVAVDDISANVPVVPRYQENQATATMDVNGTVGDGQTIASSTIFNSCPNINLTVASTLTGNAWDVAFTQGEAPTALGNAFITGEGQVVNVDITGLGTSGPNFLNNPGVFQPNFSTTSFANQTLPLVFAQSPGTVYHAQMIVADPTRPDGFALSAPARAEWVNDTIPVTLAPVDDGFDAIDLGCLGTFDWCGVPQTTFYVNSNGTVGFGAGDGNWNSSVVGGAGGAGRVGFWSDLSPQLGTLTVTQPTATTVRVDFIAVPYFSPSSVTVTYYIDLDLTNGDITVGGLGGINPNTTGAGGGDSQWLGLSCGGLPDPGATVFGAGLGGGPGNVLYEFNDGTVAPVLPASVAGGMTSILFSPDGAGGYFWLGT